MNSDTIVNALAGINPPNAPVVLSNPTAITLFEYAPSAFVGDNPGTLLPVVLNVPSQPSQVFSAAGTSGSGAGVYGGASLAGGAATMEEWTADSRAFIIRAFGKVSPLQVSKTLTLDLYWGNGIGLTNGGFGQVSLINAAQALSATNPFASNWYLESRVLWDSTSTRLNAYTTGQINGTSLGPVAVTIPNVPAGQVQFTCGASLNDSGANQGGNVFTITLVEFSAERL